MNWLFPLYLAGAVAIAVPILLHLRRRPPQDRVDFSSLLFLDAQTPVPVSKRRLEHWLLLALRCLALLLLTLMFSRPFLQSEDITAASPHRATLILIDRSASMRREDLWTRAVAALDTAFRSAKNTDRIAVATFDRDTTPLWTFEEDRQNSAARLPAVQSRLKALTPSWSATQLDRALISAVSTFDTSTAGLEKRIHLITDLQEGSRLDALRSIAWPAELTLHVERLDPAQRDNLSLTLAARDTTETRDQTAATSSLRLRVSNTRDSQLRDFSLAWSGATAAEKITTQMPAGASRILTAPPQPAKATELTLSGDRHDFDNRVFIAPPQPRAVRIHFYGKDATRDEAAAPLFYLSRALQPTETLSPQLTAEEKIPTPAPDLLFITGSDRPAGVREYLERGGFVVHVPTDGALLKELLQTDLTVTAAPDQDYRMLAEVKTDHPLLKPFADPKLRDFTKLRFWKHRIITVPPHSKNLTTLATFDKGHPAILTARIGAGTLIIMASGWHPAESQLALSTKFVPLLYGWLAAAGFSHDPSATLLVGDVLPLDASLAHTITDPAGEKHSLDAGRSFTTTQIGLYHTQSGSLTQTHALNLPPEESRVLPLEPQKLAEYGVKLTQTTAPASETTASTERLSLSDTEQRQSLWWWFLASLLAVLLLETALAGRSRPAVA